MFGSILAATSSSSSGGGLVTFAPLLLMGVVGYFLLIRPQQRRVRAQQTLQRSIEEGDEVLTTSGLYATVIEIDDEDGTVTLEIAPGVRIKAVRGAIAQRITEDEYEDEEDDDAEASTSGFLADSSGDDAAP